MNEIDLLKKIRIEDFIWIVNFFVVFFALMSNDYEENYIKTHNESSKNVYKTINTTILIVAFIIYAYFSYTRYQSLHELKNTSSKQEILNTNLNFIASLLVVIATLLFIYTEITGQTIEAEEITLI